jgi:hypothetical protein
MTAVDHGIPQDRGAIRTDSLNVRVQLAHLYSSVRASGNHSSILLFRQPGGFPSVSLSQATGFRSLNLPAANRLMIAAAQHPGARGAGKQPVLLAQRDH